MTVKWYVAKKNLVKFAESEDAYAVVEGLTVEAKAGDKVEVEIEDKVVVKMEKLDTVQKEEKKEEKAETKEVKTEPEPSAEKEAPEVEPSTEEPVVVTWTVAAYSPKNAVIKFEEQESAKYWYPIKDKIVPSFEGINKGDKITVKIGKVEATAQSGNRYMKDGIIAIDKDSIKKNEPEQKETEAKEEKPQTKKENYRPSTNESIERQVALKGAIELIKDEMAKRTMTNEEVQTRLTFLTSACLEAMRNA